MKKTIIFIFQVLMLMAFADKSYSFDLLTLEPTPWEWYRYKEIVLSLKKEHWSTANKQILTMLESRPEDWRLLLSLGIVFRGQEQFDKSIQALLAAEALVKDSSGKFAINFNLGEVYGKKREIDLALKYYQKALEINPDSRETKVNIELLLNQQSQGGKGKGDDNKDKDPNNKQGDDQKEQDKDSDQKENQPKNYKPNNPSQGKDSKTEELSEADAKKILDEIGRQEKKIRAEFFRKQRKEKPRDKDW